MPGCTSAILSYFIAGLSHSPVAHAEALSFIAQAGIFISLLRGDARASAIEERREVRRSRRAGDRDADGGDEGEDDPAESKRAGFRSYLDEMDGLEGGSSFDRGRTPLPEDDDEDDFLRQLLEMDLDGGGDPGPPAPPAASTSPPPVTAARRASSPGPPPSRAEPAADESTQSTVLDDEQFLDELFGCLDELSGSSPILLGRGRKEEEEASLSGCLDKEDLDKEEEEVVSVVIGDIGQRSCR